MRDSETDSLGSGLDIAPRYYKEVDERVRALGRIGHMRWNGVDKPRDRHATPQRLALA